MPRFSQRLSGVIIGLLFLNLLAARSLAENGMHTVGSPDHRIVVTVELTTEGEPVYRVDFDGSPVLRKSKLGLVRDDEDFSRRLTLVSATPIRPVEDRYEILTAKRRVNHYRANREEIRFSTPKGSLIDLIFQVSNDGVAFRYSFPEASEKPHSLERECTSYHLDSAAKAWLQPLAIAKTGWMRTNPSYEEYYQKEIPVGKPSPTGAGWVYPALFKSGNTWLVISEGSLPRNYCGTHLRADSPDGEYFVDYADLRETVKGGPSHPVSKLPWVTPWRLVVVGDLHTVAESMLGVDLADAPAVAPAVAARPGKASWSWPLLGDDKTTYEVQKKFIDYAAEMGWRYCLIDAGWDVLIGYEKVKQLADYARSKGVAILLWYNSRGDWNDAPQTPRDRMLTHESRLEEFARLKAMGIAGLKIDFFGGDGQSVISYYHDILDDAVPFGFAMNFHGATLPRGWQRTYPNLMTMEAIRGLEYISFEQKNADEEPTHAAMLPFTRNLFDPMDFTPMVLDRLPNVERRTTSAFELALSILFTSGIQHYAEIPEGMSKAPDYVRAFLRHVPAVWDEMHFIDGYPGRYVVVARRGEGHWYVAGINGTSEPKNISLDLRRLGRAKKGTLIADGNDGALRFRKEEVTLDGSQEIRVSLPATGGFVIEFDPED